MDDKLDAISGFLEISHQQHSGVKKNCESGAATNSHDIYSRLTTD